MSLSSTIKKGASKANAKPVNYIAQSAHVVLAERKQHQEWIAFTGAWAWPLTDKRRWCHQDFI
jgi:hypothetical protein